MLKYNVLLLLFRIFQKQLKFIYYYFPDRTNACECLTPYNLTLSLPDHIKFLRVDVGLSDDASHSVDCLLDHDDRAIIGIEPHPENISKLKRGTNKFHSISLKHGYVRKGYNIKKIDNIQSAFFLIQGAAGSTKIVQKRNFYSAFPDRGNSGFYNTQNKQSSGNNIEEILTVDEFPLTHIFKQIDFTRFEFIESLKIDTEGHDLEVLKGCGKYLEKILFCRVECFKGIYPQTQFLEKSNLPGFEILGDDGYFDSASAIIEFMNSNKFDLVSTKPGDYVFLNRKLRKLLLKNEVYPG